MIAASGDMETTVTGIAYDSRRVQPGDIFFGLSGLEQDGQAYVRQALTAGAVAAVVEKDTRLPGATLVQVGETRTALAQASARFFGFPSRELRAVGVTGTNGKTTTTFLLEAAFRAAGLASGVVGTTGYRLRDETRPAPFTTPEAPQLQELLREMLGRGVHAAALELSSHAIVQRRCFALDLDVAVFTNLSHDHLDYHGSLEAYLDAKLRLFDGRNQPAPSKRTHAVVNADDPAAKQVLAAAATGNMATTTFGRHAEAGVRIAAVKTRHGGLDVTLDDRGPVEFALPMLGRHNAWNAAAAYTACRALGLEVPTIATGLSEVRPVPGRLERIDAGQSFEVVVDYAHTPDALRHAFDAVREHARGRVLAVFGCGGDRDRAKREPMGRAAAELSDIAWITNDNPRSEDPRTIAADVRRGDPEGRLRVELDRAAAIGAALDEAHSGDVVLIAGKGHETTQTFADRVVPFDDREVARAHLGSRGRR